MCGLASYSSLSLTQFSILPSGCCLPRLIYCLIWVLLAPSYLLIRFSIIFGLRNHYQYFQAAAHAHPSKKDIELRMAEGGNKGRVVGDYVLQKQIGSGSFSVVWHARHRHGYEVAIKEIATQKLTPKLRENLLSETKILRQIKHPNIIRLHDIVEESGRIYIVLEYCTGGDLAAHIQRYGRFSEAVARHFMIQLAAGLKVLRDNNLIHRDLKPQNLLLSTDDGNAVLKIADFGFARALEPQRLAETVCGSPLYMAPEIMQSRKYDAKADLWSVGTILFQLVTGNPPFSGNTQIQLMHNIMRSNELHFPDDIVGDLHPDCIDLCQKLLRRDPVERLSFEEFFNHKFMIQTRPIGGYGSTSMGSGDSSVVETADASQDDCLPLTLDKDPQSYSPSLFPIKNTSSISCSCSHLDTNTLAKRNLSNMNFPASKEALSDILDSGTNMQFSTSKYNLQMPFECAPQKVSTLEGKQSSNVEQELVNTTSPKGVVDSLESIEEEYVVINAHAASTETLSFSLGASGLDHSQSKVVVSPSKKIQKSISAPMQIVGVDGGSVCGVECLESQSSIPLGSSEASVSSRDVLDRPSDHIPTRLDVLRRCAYLITELAKEKLEAGLQLEVFAILLVCLAIWKQALRVSHTWAASFAESSPCEGLVVHSRDMQEEGDFQGAAAACSQMEQEFLSAVDSAVQLVSHLGPLDGNAEMPDAIEIVFQKALTLGRKGAMEELFGAMDNAAALYLKSTTLLSFILVEASSLELNPPFSLSISDRQRLHRYIDCLTQQNQSIAHSRVFVQREEQQSL